MTAEVAVMNKQAIALAADSAVTFGGEKEQKIFTSASKIFTLSKYEPVGVMVYGNASLMDVPWETIIKVYRGHLGKRTFKTIGDYAENFLTFLAKNEQLFPEDVQNWYVNGLIYTHFQFIANEVKESVNKIITEKSSIDDETVKKITSRVVKDYFERWKEAELSRSVPDGFTTRLREKYRNPIKNLKQEVFENLPLTRQSSRQLTEIAINLFTKFPSGLVSSNHSGIVIAGFGTDDVFPVLEAFSVEGKISNYLKHKRDEEKSTAINFQNSTAIIPFAQSEMVSTFMTGADPNYHNTIDRDIEQIFTSYPEVLVDNIDCLDQENKENLKLHLKEVGQKEFEKYRKRLLEYRKEHFINPVMQVVRGLPKDELAAMAESLINLTSFKRRVSMEEETVGGPIDVAVISKGDGFVWIKRKHYFERELNQRFFENYYKEADIDGTKASEPTG